MANLDNNNLPITSYDYPIINVEMRQGSTNPVFVIRVKDSDEGNYIATDPTGYIGSIAVIKPTGYEEVLTGQLEMVGDSDGKAVFVIVPTSFSNGLNPLVNRPVKCAFDIWQTDDGVTPRGSGIVGGVIYVRERITKNTRVGSSNVSTM
jgi:hypothetical protein